MICAAVKVNHLVNSAAINVATYSASF